MSDDATSTTPTPTQLKDAGLVAVTEINGYPPRSYNPTTKKFPPETIYISSKWNAPPTPPTPPAPTGTLSAVATSDTTSTVTWENFTPVSIGRNGTDSNGGGPWSTTTIVGTSQEFSLLVPGDTYTYTATDAAGDKITVTLAQPAAPVPTPTPTPTGLSIPVVVNAGGVSWPANPMSGPAQQVLNLGAKAIRWCVAWNYAIGGGSKWTGLEMTPGVINQTLLALVKSTAELYNSMGLENIIIIDGLVSSPAAYVSEPTSPEQFASICATLAATVPGQRWELINEPDLESTGDNNPWKTAITPAAYTQAVQLAYAAMKKADPTCKVNAFVVSSPQDAAGFVKACVAAGLTPEFYDNPSIHAYPETRTNGPTGLVAQIEALGLSGVQVTEAGWQAGTASGDITPAEQATYWTEFLTQMSASPSIVMGGIYCMQDYDGGDWGLITQAGVEKPAFAAIASLIAG